MVAETCENCRFWAELGPNACECRRYAPRARAKPNWGHWPNTEPTDWCGEFSASEESAMLDQAGSARP